MHAVGFVLGIPENELDSRLEMFLEDYIDDDSYYIYYDTMDDYDSFEQMALDHPDVKTDSTKYGRVNPYGQCDYWSVGGRWEGYFLLKDGTRANSTTIGQIDFEKMEDDARELARKKYRAALEAINGDKNFKSFEQIRKEYDGVEGDQWKMARDAYVQQKPVKDFYAWRRDNDKEMTYFDFNIDDLLKPVSEYEKKVIVNKMTPCAVIHDDMWEELEVDVDKNLKWLHDLRKREPDLTITMIDYHV